MRRCRVSQWHTCTLMESQLEVTRLLNESACKDLWFLLSWKPHGGNIPPTLTLSWVMMLHAQVSGSSSGHPETCFSASFLVWTGFVYPSVHLTIRKGQDACQTVLQSYTDFRLPNCFLCHVWCSHAFARLCTCLGNQLDCSQLVWIMLLLARHVPGLVPRIGIRHSQCSKYQLSRHYWLAFISPGNRSPAIAWADLHVWPGIMLKAYLTASMCWVMESGLTCAFSQDLKTAQDLTQNLLTLAKVSCLHDCLHDQCWTSVPL